MNLRNTQAAHWQYTFYGKNGEELKEEEWDPIGNWLEIDNRVKYQAHQLERCPDTNRLHIQGYVQFKRSVRGSVVQDLLGERVHLDKTNSPKDAIKYVTKEDTRVAGPWMYGVSGNGQGQRNDIEAFVERLGSAKFCDIALENPMVFVKYHAGLEKIDMYKKRKAVPEWRNVNIICLYGQPGTGKTRFATNGKDSDDYFIKVKSGDKNWWCGYEYESTLILDDYAGWIPYRELLKVLDGNRIILGKKNGSITPAWTTVYITSNKPPWEWYSDETIRGEMWDHDNPQRGTLSRRINQCFRCEEWLDGYWFTEVFNRIPRMVFNREYELQ